MPFNKGDFTQQGVNGHVNATVRLNEKRLVNIDLTSNEEAEGCTINGTVKDLLNNKVYGIGSGVSGNIEITENGENINVAPYATATVNVAGGGGIENKLLTLHVVNNTSSSIGWDNIFASVNLWQFENNTLDYCAEPTIASGDSYDFVLVIPASLPVYPVLGFNVNVTVTDTVNCTINARNDLSITSANADASCTATLMQL